MIFLLVEGFSRDLAHLAHGAAATFFVMLGIGLYRRRRENAIVRILFAAIALLAAMLVKDTVYQAFGSGDNSGLGYSSWILEMVWVPVILTFNFGVLAPGRLTRGRIACLFAPFVLMYAVGLAWPVRAVFLSAMVFTALFAAAGFCITFAAVARYNRYVRDNYSDADRMAVSWLRIANIIFVLWYAHTAAAMLADSWYADAGVYALAIAVWATIYRYSVRHRAIDDLPDVLFPKYIHPPAKASEPADEPATAGDIPEAAAIEPHTAHLMIRICACFELEKPYLNPDLTLNDVAGMLRSNRSYISKAINTSTGATFFQFVNRYRALHAAELIRESGEMKFTLETIARQSGFNSMTTFYTFFKKEKGCTPGDYIRKGNPGK
jgi:AraC-like DNA-binding protein